MPTLVPDLILDLDGVRRGLAVDVADGLIEHVGPAADAGTDAVRLPGLALLPGFANAHSHAFQRDLRGVVERVDRSRADDDFWTWREAMYAEAGRLDPAGMRDVARRCFREMRRAGYTQVGEFHYVHHRPDGLFYDDPNVMAKTVCEAAEAEGLRIVLLLVAYARAGADLPPYGGQVRFSDPDVETYLARLEELAAWAADRPLVTVGAAPHSVRAVPRDWLEEIALHCAEHALPLHIHADEQPREIVESIEEHGLRPVALLEACGALGPRTTIVHGTHADAAEIALLADAGACVCVCPSTEANLGDGYGPVQALHTAGVRMSVGSDSNAIVDPFQELRELEAIARRTAGRRNVLVADGDPGPAPSLLRVGWEHGPRCLGLPRGRVAPGGPADLIAIDLAHDQIAGIADEHLAAGMLFSGSAALVARSWVAGVEPPG